MSNGDYRTRCHIVTYTIPPFCNWRAVPTPAIIQRSGFSTGAPMTMFRTVFVAGLRLGPALSVVGHGRQSEPTYQERDFLTRVRRLTIEGKRAGEGYWSPDGKRLVF